MQGVAHPREAGVPRHGEQGQRWKAQHHSPQHAVERMPAVTGQGHDEPALHAGRDHVGGEVQPGVQVGRQVQVALDKVAAVAQRAHHDQQSEQPRGSFLSPKPPQHHDEQREGDAQDVEHDEEVSGEPLGVRKVVLQVCLGRQNGLCEATLSCAVHLDLQVVDAGSQQPSRHVQQLGCRQGEPAVSGQGAVQQLPVEPDAVGRAEPAKAQGPGLRCAVGRDIARHFERHGVSSDAGEGQAVGLPAVWQGHRQVLCQQRARWRGAAQGRQLHIRPTHARGVLWRWDQLHQGPRAQQRQQGHHPALPQAAPDGDGQTMHRLRVWRHLGGQDRGGRMRRRHGRECVGRGARAQADGAKPTLCASCARHPGATTFACVACSDMTATVPLVRGLTPRRLCCNHETQWPGMEV